LYGKIDPRTFGDRVARGRPQDLEEKLTKRRKKMEAKETTEKTNLDAPKKLTKRQRASQEESVLSIVDDGMYRPRTKETRAAYEALLSTIQQQFGDQPQDILRGAADEVLGVLKNDRFKDPDKKKEIEKLLNTMTNERFAQLVAIGKLISDYSEAGDAGAGGAGEALDDDIGVAVEFEEDEEEDESDMDEVQEESDGDEDGQDTRQAAAMQMGGVDDEEMEEADEGLNVQDIDAYWLQRKISQAYGDIDPQQSQKLAEEVLQTLAQGDDRDVENRLVMLLDYDKFDLIKLLLRNRLKVVWCTRLARAEDEDAKKKIEEEMSEGGLALLAILEQLHATRATAKERQKNLERSIREEARKLRDEGGETEDKGRRPGREVGVGVESSWLKGQRQLLDLEQLSFHQGGLLMANKKYQFLSIPLSNFHWTYT
jgi:pre-mRNA-splicing helicase BRR2